LALAQLRPRGIPGALAILLERIDSPHHVVREAARESLAEFNFKRFLAAYDMLEEDVRRSTGLLVKRIDAQAIPQLRQELSSTSGRRRKRGLAIARTLQAVDAVEDTICELLAEDDHLIRAEAAMALGDCDSATARAALELALEDNSVAVREAVVESLARLDQRGSLRPTASAAPIAEARL
jgi:HEAT repeat protein